MAKRTPLTIVAVVAAVAVGCGAAHAAPVVFVLAGQSNMVGYAQPVPAETVDPHIERVNQDGTLTPAVDPLFHQDPYAGTGPGYWFARALEDAHPDTTIGLVPCAVAGTVMAQWQPGTPLFEGCVDATLAAVARGATVGGILFFQGESDAGTPAAVAAWPSGFAAFVAGIRARLGSPSAPVVFAQIGSLPAADPAAASVAAMQAAQATVSLPNVSMITTSDLAYGDPASRGHFGPAAVRTIGSRFAEAWSRLTPAVAPAPAPAPPATASSPAPAPASEASGGGAAAPDLSLEIKTDQSPTVGGGIVYRVRVYGKPDTGATSQADATVTVPDLVKIGSVQLDHGPGCTITGQTVSCDLAWVNPGQDVTIIVTGTVTGLGDLTATASVWATGEYNRDDNTKTLTLSETSTVAQVVTAHAPASAKTRPKAKKAKRAEKQKPRAWLGPH